MIVTSPSQTKSENTGLEEIGALIFAPLFWPVNSMKLFGPIGFGRPLDEPFCYLR